MNKCAQTDLIKLKNELITLLSCLPNPVIPEFTINDGSIYFENDPLNQVWQKGDLWFWKMTERGKLRLNKQYDSRLALVVDVLDLYITEMAAIFERDNRVEDQDSRKLWFAYHDMLFTILGEPYISKAKFFYTNHRYTGTFDN